MNYNRNDIFNKTVHLLKVRFKARVNSDLQCLGKTFREGLRRKASGNSPSATGYAFLWHWSGHPETSNPVASG